MSSPDLDAEVWEPTIEEAFAKPTLSEKLFPIWLTITTISAVPVGCLVLLLELQVNKEPVLTIAAGMSWIVLGYCLKASAYRDIAYRDVDEIQL